MKKKYTTTAYMRDAEDYLTTAYDLKDYYLVVKKINKVKQPWFTQTSLKVMDDGYYMIECTPKNEFYSMRVFYNQEKEPLLYYFDITNGNGFDDSTNAPYYIDIYTDIIIDNNKIFIIDENELEDALKNNDVTKEEYDKAKKTTLELFEELNANKNKYKNTDFTKYLI